MQRGPKPETVDTKLARGTFQLCRDGNKTQIIPSDDPPQMPDYLTPEAEIVWQEMAGRVMASGVGESDSAFLARYCAVEAISRDTLSRGEAIPSAVMTALRQMEELLGIAGPKSRVVQPKKQEAKKGFAALRGAG